MPSFHERRIRVSQQLDEEQQAKVRAVEEARLEKARKAAETRQMKLAKENQIRREIENDSRWQEMMRLAHDPVLAEAMEVIFQKLGGKKTETQPEIELDSETSPEQTFTPTVIADHKKEENHPVGSVYVFVSADTRNRYDETVENEFCVRLTWRDSTTSSKKVKRRAGLAFELPGLARNEEASRVEARPVTNFGDDYLKDGQVFYSLDEFLNHLARIIEVVERKRTGIPVTGTVWESRGSLDFGW